MTRPTHNGVVLGPNSPLVAKGGRKRYVGPDEASIQTWIVEALVGEALPGEGRIPGAGLTGQYPELGELYAINPNKGGARSKAAAGRAKAMGLRPGMPDLHLPVARGPFIGCYVEVKRPGGSTDAEQRATHERLRAEGHCVIVVDTVQAGVDVFVGYCVMPTIDADVSPSVLAEMRRLGQELLTRPRRR